MRDSLFWYQFTTYREKKEEKHEHLHKNMISKPHLKYMFLLSYSAQCNWRLVSAFKIEGQVTQVTPLMSPTEPIYDQCPALTFFLGLSCISFACFMFETELSNIKSGSRIHSSKSQYNKFLVCLVGLSCSAEEKKGIRKAHFKSHYEHIKCLCCAFL